MKVTIGSSIIHKESAMSQPDCTLRFPSTTIEADPEPSALPSVEESVIQPDF